MTGHLISKCHEPDPQGKPEAVAAYEEWSDKSGRDAMSEEALGRWIAEQLIT